MESGILEGENLVALLRSISQRKRQGVLEIHEQGNLRKICFVQGRIVEFLNGDKPPAFEVAEKLCAAGYLASMKDVPLGGYKEVFEHLKEGKGGVELNRKIFLRAVRHRVLEQMYTLNAQSGAPYLFTVQMIEYEKDFAPVIPTGQVLLDLVALHTEGDRYNALFPSGSIVRAVSEEEISLSEEEEIIYRLCKTGLSVEDLVVKSLLSSYSFQEAVLSLLDRGSIQVETPQEEASVGAEDLLGAAALDALDNVIDRTFGAGGEQAQVSEELAPEAVIEEEIGPRSWLQEADERLKLRLRYWSSILLQKESVAQGVAVLFSVAAIAIPALFWWGIFEGFAR